MRVGCVAVISVIAAAGGVVAAQMPMTEPQPTFRTAVELVVVHVNVADREKRPIGGLTKDDFVLLENGVPQQVAHCLSSEVPLDLALVLDGSSSMAPILPMLHASAGEFLDGLRPQDRGMVVGFDHRTRILAGLTGDRGELRRSVSSVRTGGDTSLYDALYITLKTVSSASSGLKRRRVVVVLSDGNDTSSMMGVEEVHNQSLRSGVPIYSILLTKGNDADISLDESYEERMQRYGLTTLSRDTGGRTFPVDDGESLEQAYAAIARELSHEYLLAYIPAVQDDSKTRPRIAVQIPSQPAAVARTHVGRVRRGPIGD